MANSNVAQDTVKEWDPRISCISTTRTKRGKFLNINYFDVPDEDYGVGFLRGADIAVELFKEMRNAPTRRLSWVLQEATKHIDALADHAPGKRGAACGLYYSVFDCLEFAAENLDLERIAQITANHAKASHARVAAQDAAQKTAFVAKMASAKAIKRANSGAEVAHV